MGLDSRSDTAREAEIDAALKALFAALAGEPTPASFHALIDQLARDATRSAAGEADLAPPSPLLRRPLRRQAT